MKSYAAALFLLVFSPAFVLGQEMVQGGVSQVQVNRKGVKEKLEKFEGVVDRLGRKVEAVVNESGGYLCEEQALKEFFDRYRAQGWTFTEGASLTPYSFKDSYSAREIWRLTLSTDPHVFIHFEKFNDVRRIFWIRQGGADSLVLDGPIDESKLVRLPTPPRVRSNTFIYRVPVPITPYPYYRYPWYGRYRY